MSREHRGPAQSDGEGTGPATPPADPRRQGSPPPAGAAADDDATPDDGDAAGPVVSERELLERTLGARLIEEIDHS